ncbi:membrane protein [Microbacterium phage Marcie]|nr:membrane protein [Microbacterium phage Marcie]
MVPQWVAEMQTSDWLMFTFAALLLFFVLDYGTGTPWWKAPVSAFTFEYGIAVLALMSLIIYGVVFGQRVEEWARIPVMFGLCVGMIGKIIVLKVSRRQGRIQRRERRRAEQGVSSPHPQPTGRNMMDTTTELSLDEIKGATTIWFKGQRVLRSIVGTLISALTVWAALTAIFPQMLAELATILPGPAIVWLTGVIAAISAVAGAISRIMAIPKVNAWLTKWLNLGSVPKTNVAAEYDVTNGTTETYVIPDRKAASS